MNTHAHPRAPWLRQMLTALSVTVALVGVAPEVEAQRTGSAPSATAAEAPTGVVNIQTASAEQLQLLPGIGPSKAEAIVAFRQRRAFRRIQDILRVRGIGRSTFRRLRSMMTVDGPTTLAPPASASRRTARSQ